MTKEELKARIKFNESHMKELRKRQESHGRLKADEMSAWLNELYKTATNTDLKLKQQLRELEIKK